MRKLGILGVLTFALLAALPVFATCPTAPYGVCMGGGFCWFDYSPDASCVSIYGNPTPTTDSMCYSRTSAIPASGGWADLSYTFTVDPVDSFPYWHAETSVDLNDPNNSSGNGAEVYAGVHVNGVPQWQYVGGLTGADGDFSCETAWGSFSADAGDTVTVVVYTFRANSNATVEASIPRIFSTSFP
jgi:hypothetical protein